MPEVALLTPVKRGRGPELRTYLRDLPSGGGPVSPFARGPERALTHFARFVIIQLAQDRPHLLFSSRFDGQEREYLAWLSQVDAAQGIWGCCERPGQPGAEPLRRYLSDQGSQDRIRAEYVVSLVADGVSARAVNRALALREQLREFAKRTQGMNALELAQAFRMLDGVRRVAEA